MKIKNMIFNKKVIIIGGILFVLILAIIGIIIWNPFTSNQESHKEALTKRLETMGSEFYENFYYKQIDILGDEKASFLRGYQTIGIKVDLDNLSRYNGQNSEEVLKEFVNKKTKEVCDKNRTQVIIYPEDPFDQNSYKIEVQLECGLEEEK